MKTVGVRTFDVIYDFYLKDGFSIPEINDFRLYQDLGDGVIKESSGVKNDYADVFFFDVSSASQSFKERYSDVISQYEVKNIIGEKIDYVPSTGEVVRMFDMISEFDYFPELEEFAIYEKVGDTLIENPGIRRDPYQTFYYDVTSASEEFKQEHSDIIEEIPFRNIEPFKGIKGKRNKTK